MWMSEWEWVVWVMCSVSVCSQINTQHLPSTNSTVAQGREHSTCNRRQLSDIWHGQLYEMSWKLKKKEVICQLNFVIGVPLGKLKPTNVWSAFMHGKRSQTVNLNRLRIDIGFDLFGWSFQFLPTPLVKTCQSVFLCHQYTRFFFLFGFT